MQPQSDQEWVRLIKLGNEEALTTLWEMLFRDGTKLACKYNQDEDMGYDAAVLAYHKLQTRGLIQFKFQSSFRSFCWVILTRELYRLIKKSPTLTPISHKVVGEEDVTLPYQLDKVWPLIRPCFEKLNENRRKVFDLVELQNKQPGEVSDILGIRRNNVNQLASRARRDLKKCLQKQGFMSSEDVLSVV